MTLIRFPRAAAQGETPQPSKRGHPYRYARHRPALLSPEQQLAFTSMAPTAFGVLGNLDGAKPTDWGDNAGSWPVRFVLMQTWGDRVTSVWNRDPDHERALICRLWFETYDIADKVWVEVYARLRQRFRDGKRDWLAFDADTVLGDITAQVLEVADQMRVKAMTDDEVIVELNTLLAIARKMTKGRG